MELRQAAGNLLMVGLTGKELSALERAWLKLIWQNRRSVREVFSLRSFRNHEIAPIAEISSPRVPNASPSTMPGS